MIDKDEFLRDHILGSGMFTYPWWTGLEMTDDGVTVTSWEGTHTITASKVRSTFVTMVMEGFPALKGTALFKLHKLRHALFQYFHHREAPR